MRTDHSRDNFLARIVEFLSGARETAGAGRFAALGAILALPALWAGRFLDDLAHRSALAGVGEVSSFMTTPLRIFTFTQGDPELNRQAIESGFFPWWTSHEILLNFWRPVSALSHILDHELWPEQAMLAHAQSLVWFVVTILVAARLYRSISPTALTAGLATLLFVVDDSHAMPVVWLANRNALLGLLFGLACLNFHLRWRSKATASNALLATLMLLLALACNEGAVAIFGYLAAYAACLESGPIRKRLLSIAPYGVVILAWRVGYRLLGFGAIGSEVYIDPGVSPLRFLGALLWRAPVLLAAQLWNLPSEPFQFLPPQARFLHWGVALALALALIWWIRPLLITSATARFWTLGMFLSIVPAVATFPSARLLTFAGIGGGALLAESFDWFRGRADGVPKLVPAVLLIAHLLLAPLIFLATGMGVGLGSRAMATAFESLEYPEDVEQRVGLVIDAPNYFVPTYSRIYRQFESLPTPESSHTLAANGARPVRIEVHRLDLFTLRVAPDGGFPFFLFRDRSRPFAAGDRVELRNFAAEIVEVDELGQPTVVDYQFRDPLESPRYLWLKMKGQLSFENYQPPPVGGSEVFESDRFSS